MIGYSGGGDGMYGAGYSTGCHLHFMVYVNGGTAESDGLAVTERLEAGRSRSRH